MAELPDQRRAGLAELWRFARCEGCGAAYLDPRPTAETLGEAYGGYYTHVAPSREAEPAGGVARLRRALRNGYVNARFGYELRPAVPGALARAALAPAPGLRGEVERTFRHLPRGRRLLDVGSGSGTFVIQAVAAGWNAVGIDVDEAVVELGRAEGLDLRFETLAEHAAAHPGAYDAVTMGHVIEHVPDPVGFLALARHVLRPGGALWIATPNLGSIAHRRYGAAWVGLDPPRHLVLFDHASLHETLGRAGFGDVRDTSHLDFAPHYFAWSATIARGEAVDISGPISQPRRDRLRALLADRVARRAPRLGEELVVLATAKAGDGAGVQG